MVSSSRRNHLARRRGREARLARMVADNAREERNAEAIAVSAAAWPRAQSARAELRGAEAQAGSALARLIDDRVPLGDITSRTGIGVVDCRRLLRLARQRKPDEDQGGTPPAG